MLEGGSGLAVGQRAAGRALGSLSSSAPQGGPEIAVENCEDTTIPQTILSFIPTNVFSDLAGTRSTSTIAVVIFSALVGLAYLKLRNRDSEQADFFRRIIDSLYGIVMCIVKMVIGLTPYGVMALIANVMATSDFAAIVDLGKFIIFSYVAIIAMFIVHLIILAANRVNPVTYLKKAFPVLSFAFVSRTSAGALPMNIETQSKALGVDEATANFAASFGMSIGQNGCAGIYPAMMATLPASLRSCLLRLRHLVCSHDDLAHLVGVCACVCGEEGGRRGRVFEGGDFAHVPGDVVPSAAGETRVRLHSHEREPERAVQALACGVRGGHHAIDRLYARKAQKLEECGVQTTSRATALCGGCEVDGKLGVPLEGDALAQLMGVGEPDDASAFLGDEAGVLLADALNALAIRLARGNFFLEGHGRADEGGVHRADAARVIGRGKADAQLRARRRAVGRGSLGVCRRVASCAQLRAHRCASRQRCHRACGRVIARSLRGCTLALSGRIAQGCIAHEKGSFPSNRIGAHGSTHLFRQPFVRVEFPFMLASVVLRGVCCFQRLSRLPLPGPLSAFRVVDFPHGGRSLRYTLFHMR